MSKFSSGVANPFSRWGAKFVCGGLMSHLANVPFAPSLPVEPPLSQVLACCMTTMSISNWAYLLTLSTLTRQYCSCQHGRRHRGFLGDLEPPTFYILRDGGSQNPQLLFRTELVFGGFGSLRRVICFGTSNLCLARTQWM